MADTGVTGPDWSAMDLPPMTESERLQYEGLFYSQGPHNGVLSGERVRDLFLHSDLPLVVLSRIWNLADETNDNLLDVGEFCVMMHLTLCHLRGAKLPAEIPGPLYPKQGPTIQLPVISDVERTLYQEAFTAHSTTRDTNMTATVAGRLMRGSGVPKSLLGKLWQLSDLTRDGALSDTEWAILSHLVRFVNTGNSLDGHVDVHSSLPGLISPHSLRAQKLRISRYHKDKAKLSALKERRKEECEREIRRHEIQLVKIDVLEKLHEILKEKAPGQINEELFHSRLRSEKDKLAKQEKIVKRLRREHERVRQAVVKAILEEQKLEEEQKQLHLEEEEIARRLLTHHRKSTKEPDPFHQLHEERKELRKKGVRFSQPENPRVHIPFVFNPFDRDRLKETPVSVPGIEEFCDCDKDQEDVALSRESSEYWKRVISLSDKEQELSPTDGTNPNKMSGRRWSATDLEPIKEEDAIFKSVPVSMEEEFWFSPFLSPDGTSDHRLLNLHRKLLELKSEVAKLNQQGGQLVFRNPEDYKAQLLPTESESRKDRSRYYKEKLLENAARRHTSPAGNKVPEAETPSKKAAREYRLKRRSLNLEQQQALGESVAGSTIKGGSAENIRGSPRSSPRVSPRTTRIISWRAGRPPSIGDSTTTQRTVPQRLDLSAKPSAESSPKAKSRQSSTESEKPEAAVTGVVDLSAGPSSESLNLISSPLAEDIESETSSGISILCDYSSGLSQPLSPVGSGCSLDPEKADSFDDHPVFIDEAIPEIEPPEQLLDLGYSTLKESLNLKEEKEKLQAETPPDIAKEEIKFPTIPDKDPSEKPSLIRLSCDSDIDSGNNSGSETPPPLPGSSPPPLPTSPPPFEPLHQRPSPVPRSQPSEPSALSPLPLFASPNPTSPTDFSENQRLSPSSKSNIPPLLPSQPPPPLLSSPITSLTENHPSGAGCEQGNCCGETEPQTDKISGCESGDCCGTQEQSESEEGSGSHGCCESPLLVLSQADTACQAPSTEQTLINSEQLGKSDSCSESLEICESGSHCESPGNCQITTSESKDFESEVLISEIKEKSGEKEENNVPVIPDERCNKVESVDRKHPIDSVIDTDPIDSAKFDGQELYNDIVGDPSSDCDIVPASVKTMSAEVSIVSVGEDVIVAKHKARKYTLPEDFVEVEPEQTYLKDDRKMVPIWDFAPDDSAGNTSAVEQDKVAVVEDEIVAVKKVAVKAEPKIETLVDVSQEERSPYDNNDFARCDDSDISDEEEGSTSQCFQLNETDTSNMLPTTGDDSADGILLVSYETSVERDQTILKPSEPKHNTSLTVEDKVLQPVQAKVAFAEPTSPKNKGEVSVERGRDFAEKVQPKYVIRKHGSRGSQELSEDDLRDQLQERRAVISQTTVMKRDVGWSPWAGLQGEVEGDSINRDETVFRWENKIAEETSIPPAERKSSEDSDGLSSKINLYSENVIREDGTTEVVDREPIANIASTRRHWENVFLEKISKKEEEVKPKGTVRHWDVKIHKFEKGSPNVENNNMDVAEINENESAIEREIRLALEREEMLRKEKAALAEKMGYHNGHSNNNNNDDEAIVIVAENEPPAHASYEEMTEVDRAAEMLRRRVMGDLEPLNTPPEDEPISSRRLSNSSSQDSDGRGGVFLNESIVEREIRETTEREEERRRERANHRTTSRGSLSDARPVPAIDTSANDGTDGMDRIRETITPEITYATAIAKPDHSGESLIARELRETREREEELRKLRQHVYAAPSNTVTESAPDNNSTSKTTPQKNGHSVDSVDSNGTNKQNTWQKEVSPYVNNNGHKRNSSIDSISSSHSSSRGGSESRTVKVQPLSSAQPEESPKSYEPCNETPIEREIRLSREREDDFRRSKGIPVPDKKPNSHAVETTTTTPAARPTSHQSDSNSTLKRLTNHRLKQEIKKEMQREETLRKEGKISTTSDERVGQPMKFVEVIDQTDSAPKRNFVVKKREVSSPKVEKPETNGSVTPTTPSGPASQPTTPVTPSSSFPKRAGFSGSATFSYKETKQKAESRIERELREMREREEELKTQRANATISSPTPADSPR